MKATVLCVELVLAKVMPTVLSLSALLFGRDSSGNTTLQHTTWQTDVFQFWSYPSPCNPPAAMRKCELHIRQNIRQDACDNPRSLLLSQCRSPTHAWRNVEAYFFFEVERCAGFEFAFVFAGAMSIQVIAPPN